MFFWCLYWYSELGLATERISGCPNSYITAQINIKLITPRFHNMFKHDIQILQQTLQDFEHVFDHFILRIKELNALLQNP